MGFGFVQPIVIGALLAEGLPEQPGMIQVETLAELGRRLEIDAFPLAPTARLEIGSLLALLSHAIQRRARPRRLAARAISCTLQGA